MDDIINRVYSSSNMGSEKHRKYIYDFLNKDNTSEPQFKGCMLYIQRIRNNLFHGLKGAYTLNKQKNMFDAINNLLDYLLQS